MNSRLQSKRGAAAPLSFRTESCSTVTIARAHGNLIALGIHALHIPVVVAAVVGVVAVAHRIAAGRATQQQASARADRGTGAGLSARGTDRRTGRGTEQRTADH